MLNTVQLAGRLTADPEMKTTPNGVNVATFTVAVDRDYQSNGEKQTDFINVVVWRKTAEFVNRYFSKGKMIILSGALQTRNYTANDGTKRYVTEVVADKVHFAGDKADTTKQPQISITEVEFDEITQNGDLPF